MITSWNLLKKFSSSLNLLKCQSNSFFSHWHYEKLFEREVEVNNGTERRCEPFPYKESCGL